MITPDQVLQALRDGNERFATGRMKERDLLAEANQTSQAQFPMAAVLGCIDSRVPAEFVFDMGIGDLFVARIAGNYVTTDMLGSLEFATQVAGAKVILVLGHTNCGAVSGACDGVKLGHLTHTLSHLDPALESVTGIDGPRDSSNDAFVAAVTRANVELNVKALTERSGVLRGLANEGKLKVLGGIYDLTTCRVTYLDA